MIVRRFLLWARTASAGQRAEAVGALAQAYLYSDLSADDRWEAETALTAMLDDPSPLVRRVMAESLADASLAARHLIVALASDQSDIAAIVLSRSPVLGDADLIDCAALGDELVQTAIALRPYLSVSVSAALAEIAVPAALATLAGNSGAEIADRALSRMVERHGSHAALREALLQRPDLPLDIRQAIAVAVSETLSAFVARCGWLRPERSERVLREAREKATVALAAPATRDEIMGLVAHLRRSGQLTPALILRALFSQSLGFVEAAFADLAGLSADRVAGLLHDRRGAGFAALYKRAGLPQNLRPAFEAALSVLRETGGVGLGQDGAHLSRRMIERVLSACSNLPLEESGKLLALLHRYEAEAARETARDLAGAFADDAALAAILEYEPRALLDSPQQRFLDAA
jgi:uncharacterized protein (DUF2336 family)